MKKILVALFSVVAFSGAQKADACASVPIYLKNGKEDLFGVKTNLTAKGVVMQLPGKKQLFVEYSEAKGWCLQAIIPGMRGIHRCKENGELSFENLKFTISRPDFQDGTRTASLRVSGNRKPYALALTNVLEPEKPGNIRIQKTVGALVFPMPTGQVGQYTESENIHPKAVKPRDMRRGEGVADLTKGNQKRVGRCGARVERDAAEQALWSQPGEASAEEIRSGTAE